MYYKKDITTCTVGHFRTIIFSDILCNPNCFWIMVSALPVFEPFDIHCHGNNAVHWCKWISRLENVFIAADVKDALLLHYSGESLFDIYETLPDMGEDFKTLKDKLGKYFQPKKNKEYETNSDRLDKMLLKL